MPPRYRRIRAHNKKYVFCVVRDPTERLISEFRYHKSVNFDKSVKTFGLPGVDCSKKGLNKWCKHALLQAFRNPSRKEAKFKHDCHLVPQSEYVFDSRGTQTCDFVLRYEHLDSDFSTLADAFNFRGKISLRVENSSKNACLVKVSDLSHENAQLVKEVYAKDYELIDSLYASVYRKVNIPRKEKDAYRSVRQLASRLENYSMKKTINSFEMSTLKKISSLIDEATPSLARDISIIISHAVSKKESFARSLRPGSWLEQVTELGQQTMTPPY